MLPVISKRQVSGKKEVNEGIERNPTDRGGPGSKIHLHVDQAGIPLGVVVVGANMHDSRLVGFTIEENVEIMVRYEICKGCYNLCLDKGYDYDRVYEEVFTYGLNSHIRSRGEEKTDLQEDRHPPRRWVVERTFAWLKGFRAVRTRYCHFLRNYIGG